MDSDLKMALNVLARTNRVLSQTEATSRIPSETKKVIRGQKREVREFVQMIATQHDLCPGCFEHQLSGQELCERCRRKNFDF